MRREKQSPDMAGSQIDIKIDDVRWKRLPEVKAFIRNMLEMSQGEATTPDNFELSIVLTSDAAVQELNRDYRGKDHPTNVLSFPGYEDASLLPGQPLALGDIILAYETLDNEAKAQGKTFRQHLAHLLIHGFLHLLGYTHETDSDAQLMESMETNIMKRAGFPDPYQQENGR